jgi:hypothetical protein
MTDNSVCRRCQQDINHFDNRNKFRFAISKKCMENKEMLPQKNGKRQKTLAGKFHNQMTLGIVLMLKRRRKKNENCKENFLLSFRSISNCYRFIFKCQEQTLFFCERNRNWQ